MEVPFSNMTSPAGLTASGKTSATSCAITPVSELSLFLFNCDAKPGSYSYLKTKPFSSQKHFPTCCITERPSVFARSLTALLCHIRRCFSQLLCHSVVLYAPLFLNYRAQLRTHQVYQYSHPPFQHDISNPASKSLYFQWR